MGGLEAAYDVDLRLNGKCVVGFLLVIIELFFYSFYDGNETSENRLKITVSQRGGSLWSKIPGRRGHLTPNICARIDRPIECHTTLPVVVFTQANFTADFLRAKSFLYGK